MRKPRAVRRDEARNRRHEDQAEQRHEPDRQRWQQRLVRQAGKHKADSAGDSDRHADARRGRHRIVDRFAINREHDGGQRSAAHTHQRAAQPDAKSVKHHERRTGKFSAEVPAIAGKQELNGDEACDDHEGNGEHAGRREGGHQRPARYAKDCGNRPQPDDAWDHQPLGAVGTVGAQCRRHDDRDGGADAKLHPHVFGDAEHAKHFEQHRYDDRAAANTKCTGK